MLKISACTIVRDEAKNVGRWVECVRPFADEIIVVDTGSKDNTREIAKAAGARLYEFPWINDFAAAKNFALEQAKGNWIVMPDADEYFTEDSQRRLRSVVRKYHQDKNVAGIITPFTNIDVNKQNEVISTAWQMRIFRNEPQLRFVGKVHETLQNRAQDGKNRDFCVEESLRFIHTGYSFKNIEAKKRRNLEILQAEIKAAGGIAPQQMGYLLDCYLGLQDFPAAVKYGRLAMDHLEETGLWGQEGKVICSYLQAVAEAEPHNYAGELKRSLEKYPRIPELWVLWGRKLLQEKQMIPAYEAYKNALNISQDKDKSHQNSAMTVLMPEVENTLGCLERYIPYYEAEERQDYLSAARAAAYSLLDLYQRADSVQIPAYMRSAQHKTSIIIPNYNQRVYLEALLDSIRLYTKGLDYEIIVIDDGSQDDSRAYLAQQKDVHIILNDVNEGFPKSCNKGLRAAVGDELLLLNNDIIVTPDWLKNLRKALYGAARAGAVSPVTNNSSNRQSVDVPYNNELSPAGKKNIHDFALTYNKTDHSQWYKWNTLVAYCFLLKREAYDNIGGLDEMFSPGNYEDDDYSLRLRRAGYELYLCKDTFVHHFGSVSFSKVSEEQQKKYKELNWQNRQKFLQKWHLDDCKYSYYSNCISDIVLKKKNCRIIEYNSSSMLDLYILAMQNPHGEISGTTKNKHDLDIGIPFKMSYTADLTDFLAVLDGEYDCIIITEDFTDLTDQNAFIQVIEKHLCPRGMLIAANGSQLLCMEKEV